MKGDYKLKAQAWSDLVARYCDRDGQPYEDMLPMIGLIQKLASSAYANGIVGHASKWTLLIAQAEANLWPGPRLEIEFDISKQQFMFKFHEGGFRKDPWRRKAEADEGFEVLERFFVKRARWFRKSESAAHDSPSPSSA